MPIWLIQKVKDLERDIIYEKYKDLIGEIISAEVYQVLSREVLLVDGEGNEIVIPKSEQISKDRFRKGESVRAVVARVDLVNEASLKAMADSGCVEIRFGIESASDKILGLTEKGFDSDRALKIVSLANR